MISRANKGILYPENPHIDITLKKEINLPAVIEVPCKAYRFCKDELDKIFSELKCKPQNIFVLGVLKKGKISFDDAFTIYTNSDCPIRYDSLVENDDVCSEEYCAEILLPYTDTLFPDVPVYQFLSNTNSDDMKSFVSYLKENYPKSIFFISL